MLPNTMATTMTTGRSGLATGVTEEYWKLGSAKYSNNIEQEFTILDIQ